MTPKEWASERIVFGSMVILGFLTTIGTAAYFPITGSSRDVVVGAVGTLGTALGMVIQAVFRTDKVDKSQAESTAHLASALNTAMTLPAAEPTPKP